MSHTSADTGIIFVSVGAEQEGSTFIVHPALNSLMLAHTFLILLIPLIISLFYFSTPKARKQPVFLLNIAAIFLAFVVGVLLDVLAIHDILEPLNPLPLALSITIGFLGVWESIFVDLILLLRLVSVYPLNIVGLMRFVLIITTPVLLKLARIINVILFTVAVGEVANKPNSILLTAVIFKTKPYLKIEWATQMFDNTYASLAFLWAIRANGGKRNAISAGNAPFSERLRTLFRIALTNFVVPTIFSVAQFISVYHGVSMQILEQLVLGNIMLSTFGVAFATVWAGKVNRTESMVLDPRRASSNVMPTFAKPTETAQDESTVE